MIENGPTCPGEHVITRIPQDFMSRMNTFVIECNGEVLGRASWSDTQFNQLEMDKWRIMVIKEHLIEYLQKEVMLLRDENASLEEQLAMIDMET